VTEKKFEGTYLNISYRKWTKSLLW